MNKLFKIKRAHACAAVRTNSSLVRETAQFLKIDGSHADQFVPGGGTIKSFEGLTMIHLERV